ncbi:MAG: response regulator [Desulfovibrio sp.]
MTDATILLVDDETAFVDTMEKRLTKRNMTVLKAYSGDEALLKLQSHPEIQVVVLDVKMPVKDGHEVLQEIKTSHPLVEVIMLTGHGTVDSAIAGIQTGAHDYLMKPCELDTLIEKIHQAVEDKNKNEQTAVNARVHDIAQRIA